MPLLKSKLTLLSLLILAGCASKPQVVFKPMQVPPLPAEIGTPRPVNLTEQLSSLLQKSSPKATETPPNSTSASKPTTK